MARTQTNGHGDNPHLDDLADQIATLKADIAGLTEIVGDIGRSKKAEVRDNIDARVQAAQDAASEHLTHARVRASEMNDEIGDFIQRKPATALGIAAGLGFLVGLIGTRK